MKKTKYIQPQTEAIAIEVGYSILRASNMGYVDLSTGETETTPIPDNDDDDFSAAAKKHRFNYNPFEDDRVGY